MKSKSEKYFLKSLLVCQSHSQIAREYQTVRISPYALTLLLMLSYAANANENTLLLEGLNKTTGRVLQLEAGMGATIVWGPLQIRPSRCIKAPPEQLPENAAFLEVWDTSHPSKTGLLFRGWMFSSSPSLSSIEHPVYDIIVLDCYVSSEPQFQPEVEIESLPPVEGMK
ncbi:MAG: hypothetical protein CMM32_05675 [Rhodospirillaceae bacterium]|nr:hypothetical protein [Rhodospirillaceae bacterium]